MQVHPPKSSFHGSPVLPGPPGLTLLLLLSGPGERGGRARESREQAFSPRQAALSPRCRACFSPRCAPLLNLPLPGSSPAELLEREPEPEFGCCALRHQLLLAAGRRLEGGSRLGRSSSLSGGEGEEGEEGEVGPWVPLTRVSPRHRHRAARHRHTATTAGWHIPASPALHWRGKQTKTENQPAERYTQA